MQGIPRSTLVSPDSCKLTCCFFFTSCCRTRCCNHQMSLFHNLGLCNLPALGVASHIAPFSFTKGHWLVSKTSLTTKCRVPQSKHNVETPPTPSVMLHSRTQHCACQF